VKTKLRISDCGFRIELLYVNPQFAIRNPQSAWGHMAWL